MPGKVRIDSEKTDDTFILIQNCIKGQRHAQTKLFETYAPFIKGVILRYISDTELVKDLLSEIFIRVFSKLHLYAPTGSFKGWIRTLSVNVIVDHARKNKKYNTTYADDFTELDPYVDSNTISNVSYKELLQLITTLPDVQRMVFNLHIFESLTHTEIGTLLNITPNNSRWHLNRARNSLKEKLNMLNR